LDLQLRSHHRAVAEDFNLINQAAANTPAGMSLGSLKR
jgi:hypothetical protein